MEIDDPGQGRETSERDEEVLCSVLLAAEQKGRLGVSDDQGGMRLSTTMFRNPDFESPDGQEGERDALAEPSGNSWKGFQTVYFSKLFPNGVEVLEPSVGRTHIRNIVLLIYLLPNNLPLLLHILQLLGLNNFYLWVMDI
jgi:hypothetical protein